MTLLELIEKALGDAETAGASSMSDATLAECYEDRGAAAASKAALLAEVERLLSENAQYRAVASEANVLIGNGSGELLPEITNCPWCGLSGPDYDESPQPSDVCHHSPATAESTAESGGNRGSAGELPHHPV